MITEWHFEVENTDVQPEFHSTSSSMIGGPQRRSHHGLKTPYGSHGSSSGAALVNVMCSASAGPRRLPLRRTGCQSDRSP
jgi:hypothetical protein